MIFDYEREWVQVSSCQWFIEKNNLWYHITLMDNWYILAVVDKNTMRDIRDQIGFRTLEQAKANAEKAGKF